MRPHLERHFRSGNTLRDMRFELGLERPDPTRTVMTPNNPEASTP